MSPNSFWNYGPVKPTQNSLDGRLLRPKTCTYQTRHRKTRKHSFHELHSNSQPQCFSSTTLRHLQLVTSTYYYYYYYHHHHQLIYLLRFFVLFDKWQEFVGGAGVLSVSQFQEYCSTAAQYTATVAVHKYHATYWVQQSGPEQEVGQPGGQPYKGGYDTTGINETLVLVNSVFHTRKNFSKKKNIYKQWGERALKQFRHPCLSSKNFQEY